MASSQPSHTKEALLSQLASLVQQCEVRFCNRYELATENEEVVSNLCVCLDQILSHGLKNQTTFLNKTKILNGIINQKAEVYFWNYISLYLTEHEVQRFLSLRNVNTDYGRGRSWLRNALNEHFLEKYFSIMIEDANNYKRQFYYDWAILSNGEVSRLVNIAQKLNSILFALNIDNPDLDVNLSDNSNQDPQGNLAKLNPIKKSENTVLVRARKKKSNFITINDEEMDESDLENDIYAKSAPVSSFLPVDSLSLTESEIPTSSEPLPKLIGTKSSSSLSIPNGNMVLYPIYDQDSSVDSVSNNDDRASLQNLQQKIGYLEQEKEKILRDNNLLKIQMKKYCAALELLKYSKGPTIEAKINNSENDSSNSHNDSVEDYQKKLIQVSEMHGELVEFNEHLYRVISQKDSIISRLRDELIELRGPLPDSDEILSISSETETHSHSLQSLPQALIHVWIPTAFLSGGFKGKSHHIYQIYIRIKEEEWNVYRRYSQFYSLHKYLKEKHSCISSFEFPPKKAIGNKDSRVVQERRKKLEFYLRNVINYVQTQHADLSSKEKLIGVLPFLSDKFIIQDRSQSDTNLTNTQPQPSQHYMGF